MSTVNSSRRVIISNSQLDTEPMPAVFSMQICRSTEIGAENNDDVVIIARDGQYFRITYRNKEESVRHRVSLTTNDTYSYFQDLLTMLAMDDSPFSDVQLNFPAMPSVMYKTMRFGDLDFQEVLMKRFDALLSNWPERTD